MYTNLCIKYDKQIIFHTEYKWFALQKQDRYVQQDAHKLLVYRSLSTKKKNQPKVLSVAGANSSAQSKSFTYHDCIRT